MSEWYECDERDCEGEVWLKDSPSLSVYHEVSRGWCWAAWGDERATKIIAAGEGLDTAIEAMADADTWYESGAVPMEGIERE